MALGWISPLLGLRIQGDIGDTTLYTDRLGRLVAYPAGFGTPAPSPLQIANWDRWRTIFSDWRRLTRKQRDDYALAARRCHLLATGPALYCYLACRTDLRYWSTICMQSGLALAAPTLR